MPGGLLLNAAAYLVEGVSPASLTTWNRSMTSTASGSSSTEAVLKPENPPIATTSMPSRQSFGRVFNHCLNTCFDRPGTMSSRHAGPASWLMGSQVDDDGDVLVTAPGVPPDVFVDTNDADRLEPGRVDGVSSRCPCARIAEFAVC